jgi:hypothetical protein
VEAAVMSTGAKVTRTCPICGASFDVYRSQITKGGGTYCSRVCANQAARRPFVRGSNACIAEAFRIGYRATPDGHITSPSGKAVRITKHSRTGYWTFSATGCRTPISVHRFAAFQLYGQVALDAEGVRHLDDNRDNNSFENILYGTKSENQLDIPLEKRRLMGMRRNRGRRQFTDDQVREIRLLLADGFSLNRLQRIFNCSLGSLTNIRDGITYQDVP